MSRHRPLVLSPTVPWLWLCQCVNQMRYSCDLQQRLRVRRASGSLGGDGRCQTTCGIVDMVTGTTGIVQPVAVPQSPWDPDEWHTWDTEWQSSGVNHSVVMSAWGSLMLMWVGIAARVPASIRVPVSAWDKSFDMLSSRVLVLARWLDIYSAAATSDSRAGFPWVQTISHLAIAEILMYDRPEGLLPRHDDVLYHVLTSIPSGVTCRMSGIVSVLPVHALAQSVRRRHKAEMFVFYPEARCCSWGVPILVQLVEDMVRHTICLDGYKPSDWLGELVCYGLSWLQWDCWRVDMMEKIALEALWVILHDLRLGRLTTWFRVSSERLTMRCLGGEDMGKHCLALAVRDRLRAQRCKMPYIEELDADTAMQLANWGYKVDCIMAFVNKAKAVITCSTWARRKFWAVCSGRVCVVCKARHALRRCARLCRVGYYCSKRCQKVDWNRRGHKSNCEPHTAA